MKKIKRKLSEYLSVGAKDVVDLTSYIKNKWLTFCSFFSSNHSSSVSRNNFVLSNLNMQNFSDEIILSFPFDPNISLTQKEELYFEKNFMNQNFCYKGFILFLHKTMFSKGNERKELFSPMQAYVEDTLGEQFRKRNFIINENNKSNNNLAIKHALVHQTENQSFLNDMDDNMSSKLFDSKLNFTSSLYTSAENYVYPNKESIIFLNVTSRISSVCNLRPKNRKSFKNWNSLNKIELGIYSCNEQYFDVPLESRKDVYFSKKKQKLSIGYLKILNKTPTINFEFSKSKFNDYQNIRGEINFVKQGRDVLKNDFILKFPITLCLETNSNSDKTYFTYVNPVCLSLFESQNQLSSFVANFFNFLILCDRIEPWSNLRISVCFEEFDINKNYFSKIKRLYFGKKFETNELFQGHFQSSLYTETVEKKLIDHNPNMPNLKKMSFPTMQDIYKDKASHINIKHPVDSNDICSLTYRQVCSCENKHKSKNFFQYCINNNAQVNTVGPIKVPNTLPRMTLVHAKKCESQTFTNYCQKKEINSKEVRMINAETYFENKDITNTYKCYFNNNICSKDKVASNTLESSILPKDIKTYNENKMISNRRNFLENLILSKDIIAHNKDKMASNAQHFLDSPILTKDINAGKYKTEKKNSIINILDTTKNENNSNLKKDIKSKSVDCFDHEYFIKSKLSHREFDSHDILPSGTVSLCYTPKYISTDKENFYSKKCKRKTGDTVINPNKKVRTENCQTAEINTPSVKEKVLSIKECCVLLKRLETSQYKVLHAIENFQDNFKDHRDRTGISLRGTKRKFNGNLSNSASDGFHSFNENNGLRYNLRNSKHKNIKSSEGKKMKYQENPSGNTTLGLKKTTFPITSKDSLLYFSPEKDETDLLTEFDTFDTESKLLEQELLSINNRFTTRQNDMKIKNTAKRNKAWGKSKENSEPKHTKKREKKKTLKNQCVPKLKSDTNSIPEAKRRHRTKSLNFCLSLKAVNREETFINLRNNKCDNRESDSFIITSSLSSTFDSNVAKSCIKYNKTIQAEYESTSSSQSHYDAKSFTRKRKNSKQMEFSESQVLHASDGSISDMKIKNSAKRNKRDKNVLKSQNSKPEHSRNAHPTSDQKVSLKNALRPVSKEIGGCLYYYNSGTVQVATLDDLCLKSTKREYSKMITRSKHFRA